MAHTIEWHCRARHGKCVREHVKVQKDLAGNKTKERKKHENQQVKERYDVTLKFFSTTH